MTLINQTSQMDDELCTWPADPQMFTRANALDQWPLPITPLTQDLVELPQERGLEAAFVSVLGVSKPSPEWTWNGCFFGYVMFGVTPSAALADNLPGWRGRVSTPTTLACGRTRTLRPSSTASIRSD